jgi:D-arabinose 5-phosphate isomerase GutQ
MIPYYENLIKTVRDAVASIDEARYGELLDQCEAALKSGHKIIASGLGKNVPICEKFVGTMNSFGLEASFLHTNSAIHGDLGIVKKGDLVILLSKSGNTSETITLANYLKDRDSNTWSFSFNKAGKVNSMTSHALVMKLDNEGDLWNVAPNNSTTVFLIVLQGIAIELSRRMGVTIEDFKMNHPGGAIGQQLKDIK